MVVVGEHGNYEVTTFRKDGPYLDGRHPSNVEFTDAEEDAKRRDFTINALFYDPERHEIIDFTSMAATDLAAAAVIRTVGDPDARFEEDHLADSYARFVFPRNSDSISRFQTWNSSKEIEVLRSRQFPSSAFCKKLLKTAQRAKPRRWAWKGSRGLGLAAYVLAIAREPSLRSLTRWNELHRTRVKDIRTIPPPSFAFFGIVSKEGWRLALPQLEKLKPSRHTHPIGSATHASA